MGLSMTCFSLIVALLLLEGCSSAITSVMKCSGGASDEVMLGGAVDLTAGLRMSVFVADGCCR